MMRSVVVDAYVGGDQHLLQVVEHFVVDLRFACDRAGQFRKNALLGLFETLVQVFLIVLSGKKIE